MSTLLPLYPPRTLAPAPELAVDPEQESRRSALAIHARAVERARDARARVIAHLHADLPAGSHLTLAAIDAHARAQCWLREAAQAVCDICEFTDNGKAAGVIWETPLDVREAA